MTSRTPRRTVSDASGKMIVDPYQVAVQFDNVTYVVDLDRYDLEAELRSLDLYTAIARGRRRDSLPHRRRSLVAQMHASAREWAIEKGIEVGTRGVVSDAVLAGYKADGGLILLPEFVDDRKGGKYGELTHKDVEGGADGVDASGVQDEADAGERAQDETNAESA